MKINVYKKLLIVYFFLAILKITLNNARFYLVEKPSKKLLGVYLFLSDPVNDT